MHVVLVLSGEHLRKSWNNQKWSIIHGTDAQESFCRLSFKTIIQLASFSFLDGTQTCMCIVRQFLESHVIVVTFNINAIPGFTDLTPSPMLSIIPLASWPNTPGKTSSECPFRKFSSEWHTPAATSLTRTSPTLGGATSMVSMTRGVLASQATAARHVIGCKKSTNIKNQRPIITEVIGTFASLSTSIWYSHPRVEAK